MGWIDVVLIGLICCVFSAIVIPVIIAFRKRKYWLLIIEAAVICSVALFLFLFPTQFPYVDQWIMGKTKEEIVSVYGQPDGNWNSDGMISYDLGSDRGFFGVMSGYDHLYYYIYFDIDGLAHKVLKGGPIGG